jgi:DNA-binding transcriptional LysR family regulator
MRPDLDALEALDAVIRHGGFAGATARLHKVQSAVNDQARKLEQQPGLVLLDGSGYRFTPMLVHRLDRPLGRTGTRLIALLGAGAAPSPAGGARRRAPRRPA